MIDDDLLANLQHGTACRFLKLIDQRSHVLAGQGNACGDAPESVAGLDDVNLNAVGNLRR